jgi:subtilase family serine protease
MLGDPETGYIVGQTNARTGVYAENTIGGTSLATPLFTATVALAQQHAGRKFGAANALFYKASKKGAFTDITSPATPQAVAGGRGGAVVTFDYHGAGNTIVTAAGFDAVTGLGVPNGAKFFAAVK